MERTPTEMRRELDEIDIILRGDGNGRPGLSNRMRRAEDKLREVEGMLDTTLAGFKVTLDKLVKADEARLNRVAGRWDTVGWVRWGLRAAAVLAPILTYMGYAHLTEQLSRIASVVNSIPPMP